jgi:hypothetical protein
MFTRHGIAALLVLLSVGAANESKSPSLEFVSGNWKAQEGELVQSDAAIAQSFALARDTNVERCVVKARVKLDTDRLNAEAGVLVHVEKPDVYVLCSIRRGKGAAYAGITRYGPYERGNRMPGDVARLPREKATEWHVIEVRTDGGHVSMTVDGSIRLAASFPVLDGKMVHTGNAPEWGPEVYQRGGRVGLATRSAAARFDDFEVMDLPAGEIIHTPLKPEYDANGRVVARWPYDWTMRAFTDWVLESDKLVSAVGGEPDAEPLDEAMAKTGWPPYVFSWATMLDDRGFDHPTQFPSHNAPLTISGLVCYYRYSGDERAREGSRIWSDWMIQHGSTPTDSPTPYLPLSTYSPRTAISTRLTPAN